MAEKLPTQEELIQFRNNVAARPDNERNSFIANYEKLTPQKKIMAIRRVNNMSGVEKTKVREANIIAEQGFGGVATGIEEGPSALERARNKVVQTIPSIFQMAGGIGGGIGGGLITKSPTGIAAGRAVGSATGGTVGRTVGLTAQSLSRGEGLVGKTPEQRERFKRDIKTTATTEAIFGVVGGVGGLITRGTGRSIEEAFLKKRVAQRLRESGAKGALDPKLYSGRVPKQIAMKASRFFNRLVEVGGKNVEKAVTSSKVKNIPMDWRAIRNEIAENIKGSRIADFEASRAEKKLLRRAFKLIQGRKGDTITPPELWEIRKTLDKIRFNHSFKDEGRLFMSKLRRSLNEPLRNVDPDVARHFTNYSTIRRTEEKLAKRFEVDIFEGETFAEGLEKFSKELLGTGNDEMISKLTAMNAILKEGDQVFDEILDVAVAESIDKQMDLLGFFNRIVFATLGGKKQFVRTGQFLRNPNVVGTGRIIGRGTVTTATNLFGPQEEVQLTP